MERKVYDQMARLDSCHWWFTARRRILDGVIERIVKPPRGARILELGAGTGHNLEMLSRFGNVEASELDPVARGIASERLGRPVVEAALPDLSMFPAGAYDMVALLDVLEHVTDD
jgi:2-polyprenyl-3-methyl-5-hydroxy-6-metoxy-1,4-benzoquinol methylase